MMRRSLFALTALVGLATAVMATAALADKSFEIQFLDHRNKCSDNIHETSVALGASDWVNLARLADVFLLDCRDVADPDEIAAAYFSKALSQNKRRLYADALKTSEKCIDVAYREPSCHCTRGMALAGLGRTTEARAECERTMTVADARISFESMRLEGEPCPRSSIESTISTARVVKDWAKALLEKVPP